MSQWTILSKQNLCILAAFLTITYIYTITTQSNKWCTYLSFTPSSRRGELNLTADERRQRNIFLAERETVYKDRNALVKNICKKYKSDETLFKRNLNAVARNLFKVDGDNKLAMCGNAKAGTTTWNKYLLLLSNLPPDLKERWSRDDIELYRFGGTLYNAGPLLRYNPQIEATNMDINEVQGFLKFSFVRNPIDRLISAYNDKMLGDESSVGYKYKFLQGKIKRRYGELNFETFVRWVLRDLKKALDPTNGIGEVLDPHWRPCFNKCAYCEVDYDVIGKVETFDEDSRYILEKNGLVGLLPDTNTSIRENQSGPKKSPEKVRQQRKEYLDELTQEQKKGLLKYFRVDFEMFGYDMRDLES